MKIKDPICFVSDHCSECKGYFTMLEVCHQLGTCTECGASISVPPKVKGFVVEAQGAITTDHKTKSLIKDPYMNTCSCHLVNGKGKMYDANKFDSCFDCQRKVY